MPLLGATAAEHRDFVEYYMKVTRAQSDVELMTSRRLLHAEVAVRNTFSIHNTSGLKRHMLGKPTATSSGDGSRMNARRIIRVNQG